MSAFRKILDRVGLAPKGEIRKAFRAGQRNFEAASINRLTSDWINSTTTIDQDTRTDLFVLRSRAKELFQNNSYARRYISLCRMNIIGPNGFKLQVKSGDWISQTDAEGKKSPSFVDDIFANNLLERLFDEWSKPQNCTVTGLQSFRSVQDVLITHAARDGEYLVRKIFDSSRFGFKLQVIDPQLLDHRLNKVLDNGNIIKMGVEIDKWRKPVAYHLLKSKPEWEVYSGYYTAGDYEIIPADEIYHGFLMEWAFQTRGFSWMSPAMLPLRMLKMYELSALTNARISASRMGYLIPSLENEKKFQGDDENSDGDVIVEAEPGTYGQLPAGWDLKVPPAEYPNQQHEMFVRSTLRGAASGLGVSYNMLANDLVGVNYSSIRAGLLDEREQWKALQTWFAESFLMPLFADWLLMGLTTGTINLPAVKFEKFNSPEWIGRRWAWVDPLKDVEAEILQVQAGFKSASRVVAERGDDLQEIYSQLKAEKGLALKYGLTLKLDEIKATKASAAGEAVEEDPSSDSSSSSDAQAADEAKSMEVLTYVRDLLRERSLFKNTRT